MPFNIHLSHQKLFKRDLFTAKVACWKAIRIRVRPMSGKTPILTKLVVLLQITSPTHCTPYPPLSAAPHSHTFACHTWASGLQCCLLERETRSGLKSSLFTNTSGILVLILGSKWIFPTPSHSKALTLVSNKDSISRAAKQNSWKGIKPQHLRETLKMHWYFLFKKLKRREVLRKRKQTEIPS